MRRSKERILTTHAGSLIRPRSLGDLYRRRARGETVPQETFDTEVRARVRDAIRQQAANGVDIANDGEQGRAMYHIYVRERLTGLGGSWQRDGRADVKQYPEHAAAVSAQYREDYVAVSPPCAIGEVTYLDRAGIDRECDDLDAAVREAGAPFADLFLTAPTPGTLASAMRNDFYSSDDDYLVALSRAMRVEYEAIVARGFVLQLDGTEMAMDRQYGFQDKPLSAFLANVERATAALNDAHAGIPADRVRLHVCWGNYEGPHDWDVPLAEIWPIVKQARVGAFMLTGANPRHQHEVDVLARSPLKNDQILVTGVIDPMTSFIEHPEVVAQRIERAARAVGDPTRVIAGTDCGFETAVGIGHVTSDIQWAKLAALRDGARLASQRLF
ncbi:MAG: hypothetical protein AB7N54_05265 [Alphaproteobacteria bacterium]